MYYLQSRYYNPVVGRFINSDEAIFASLNDNVYGKNLFAYCNNSPVSMVDNYGYKPKYVDNQSYYGSVIINGTRKLMRNVKWGLLGNIYDNGCGVIAAYNVLLSYNEKTDFGKVLNEMWAFGGPFLQGIFGTHWHVMTKYLRSKFWLVYTAGLITKLWGIKAELSTCVIVLFKWPGWDGLHFIAGIGTGKNRTGGSFKFYNTGLDIEKKEISIWKLIESIKRKGGTPIAFWGVYGKKGRW